MPSRLRSWSLKNDSGDTKNASIDTYECFKVCLRHLPRSNLDIRYARVEIDISEYD